MEDREARPVELDCPKSLSKILTRRHHGYLPSAVVVFGDITIVFGSTIDTYITTGEKDKHVVPLAPPEILMSCRVKLSSVEHESSLDAGRPNRLKSSAEPLWMIPLLPLSVTSP